MCVIESSYKQQVPNFVDKGNKQDHMRIFEIQKKITSIYAVWILLPKNDPLTIMKNDIEHKNVSLYNVIGS